MRGRWGDQSFPFPLCLSPTFEDVKISLKLGMVRYCHFKMFANRSRSFILFVCSFVLCALKKPPPSMGHQTITISMLETQLLYAQKLQPSHPNRTRLPSLSSKLQSFVFLFPHQYKVCGQATQKSMFLFFVDPDLYSYVVLMIKSLTSTLVAFCEPTFNTNSMN